MSNQINDGGPAFPHPELDFEVTMDDGRKAYRCYQASSGMTLRQYAAIKLAVPDSGLPWLDEMIVKSNRERLAAEALQGLLANGGGASWDDDAKNAYRAADAMIRAREVKP